MKQSSSRPSLRAAVANGRKQAREVLAFRAAQRPKRNRAVRAAATRGVAPAVTPAAGMIKELGPAASAGVLLAEGDSWFDYPFHDVLRMLEDDFGYDVESVAHKGDRVEDMAYAKGQFEELARRLEKLIRQHRVPRAILLSGGGNDIAGEEFVLLLNHAASALPPINDSVVTGVIDQRLRDAYATIVSALDTIASSYLGRPIPIIAHGYDYPIPDGRGYLGGFWVLPGPWLRPGFERKGYPDLERNTGYMKVLIDRFNQMLAALSRSPEFPNLHYLDLRKTLVAQRYKDDWDNELHPTRRGFGLVTAKLAGLIEGL